MSIFLCIIERYFFVFDAENGVIHTVRLVLKALDIGRVVLENVIVVKNFNNLSKTHYLKNR